MQKEKPPYLLNVKEAARRARVSPFTIYKRIYDGELPAIQLGGPHSPIRIREDVFNNYLFGDPSDAERAAK